MFLHIVIKDEKYVFRGQKNLQNSKVDPKTPFPRFTTFPCQAWSKMILSLVRLIKGYSIYKYIYLNVNLLIIKRTLYNIQSLEVQQLYINPIIQSVFWILILSEPTTIPGEPREENLSEVQQGRYKSNIFSLYIDL